MAFIAGYGDHFDSLVPDDDDNLDPHRLRSLKEVAAPGGNCRSPPMRST